jgi:hypothetical protein
MPPLLPLIALMPSQNTRASNGPLNNRSLAERGLGVSKL